MSRQAIEGARSELRLTLEKLIEEAKEVVDGYWIEWRLTNSQLREREKQTNAPEGYLRGNIAPRITERTGKTYIEWLVYGPGRYGGRQKSWGERIAPRKGPVYHMSQFQKKAQPWELELIEQAEMKLRPLRYAIENVHGSQAYLSRLLSKMKDAGETDEAEEIEVEVNNG
ncbi:conjugative transfer protein MobI(A/C) [Vibrio parahaemolyticus]|uniref:conjugative transfer protein MobI(A/C) n=1 Tax=Vibrio parahaemolyticus TaxID=670 RepID=UPI0023ECD04D|nr:conjugative transfer protein MobI(A/C) [Vibrio parahaemolyticus]